MSNRKAKTLAIIIFIGIGLKFVAPAVFAEGPGGLVQEELTQQVQLEIDETTTPLSIQMVDQAVAVLSRGWSAMASAEQEAFLTLYDPSETGQIDEEFVATVLANYHKIRATLNEDITVVYETDSGQCMGMRLYYIDLIKLHVCPYFKTEDNEVRKARTLVHEMTHKALLVMDRPYYRPTSKQYAELTPLGSWLAQLPLIGRILREIVRGDTLFHPDAYAHFALAVSGLAGSEDYLEHDTTDTISTMNGTAQEALSDNQ
jgi:hypothetical protein